jgi:hypothetical protein
VRLVFDFEEQQVFYDCLKRAEAVLKRFGNDTGYNSARDTPYIVLCACAMYTAYAGAQVVSVALEQQQERRLWRRIKRLFTK